MEPLAVLVANEPRAYRDVIAAALRALRPRAEIVLGDPARLDEEVARLRPGLVLCSRVTGAVRARALAWVLLYPEEDAGAVVGIAGRETPLPTVEFADLLAAVDRAEELAHRRE